MAFAALRSPSTPWSRLLAMALCALLLTLVLGHGVHQISHLQDSPLALADVEHAPDAPTPLHGKLCVLCVALADLTGGLPASVAIGAAATSYLAPSPPGRDDTKHLPPHAYDTRAPPA